SPVLSLFLHTKSVIRIFSTTGRPPSTSPFPYTTLFRSAAGRMARHDGRRELRRRTTLSAAPRGGGAQTRMAPAHRRARRARGPEIGRAPSELQSREKLVCRLLLEKKNVREKVKKRIHET